MAQAQDRSARQALLADMSPKSLYLLKCSGCHRGNGLGAVAAGVPPFPGFIGPMARDSMGRTYITQVPGIRGSGLSDAQVASVLNYVLQTWPSVETAQPDPFTPDEVAQRRATRLADVVSYRRALVTRLSKKGIPIGEYPWP